MLKLNLTKLVSSFGLTAILTISPLLFGVQRAPHLRFPPVVNVAMTRVQRVTHAPLFAPTWIPQTTPLVIGGGGGYPVAWVQAERTTYTVTIDYARYQLPVNSKRWASENLDPMLNPYLTFGTRQYATSHAALAAVRQQGKMQLGLLPRASRVPLAPHQTAQYWLADGVSLMTWHEHGWTVKMAESFAASSPTQAKVWATQAATLFIASVPPCPSHHGVLIQEGGGSMNTVTALWAISRNTYTVGSGFGMRPVAKAIATWNHWSPTGHSTFWTSVSQWWDHLVG